jgi:hypothetical protein
MMKSSRIEKIYVGFFIVANVLAVVVSISAYVALT